MTRSVDSKTFRIAVLVTWFGLTEDSDLQNRIKNELWCLRNGVDTAALHDITVAEVSTTDVIQRIMTDPQRKPDEHAAFILCTLQEIS